MSLKSILAVKGDEVVSINSNADLAAAAKLLKKRQIGVLVVLDAGGRLVHANASAHAMIDEGDALRVVGGRLVACEARADRDLRDVFAAAGEGDAALGIRASRCR